MQRDASLGNASKAARNSPASGARGPASPRTLIGVSAIRSAAPVLVIAVPSGIIPPTRKQVFQSMPLIGADHVS